MKIRVVVLAGGLGKRMQSDIPKVLTLLHEKPLVSYVVDAVRVSGVDPHPVVVVGAKAQMVKDLLGDEFVYAHQPEQLGTGDAVKAAKEVVGDADGVIVLYGDMPFLTPVTIINLKRRFEKTRPAIVMATTQVSDFNDWRISLNDFGRIIRDAEGRIQRVIELKDASHEEREIKELNPSFFCFRADWLWKNIEKLDNKNAQNEYYLVDLVRIAMDGGDPIVSIEINPLETMGVNTREQLELAGKVRPAA